jgi:hypothetical protein
MCIDRSAVSLRVAKCFLKKGDKSSYKALLEQQLSANGVPLDDSRKHIKVRVKKKKPFMCYTDPSLGKPWKAIVEEVVKEDILRKKKIAQKKNAEAMEERRLKVAAAKAGKRVSIAVTGGGEKTGNGK